MIVFALLSVVSLALGKQLLQNRSLLLFLFGKILTRRLGGTKLFCCLLSSLDRLCDEFRNLGYLVSLLLGRVLVFGNDRTQHCRSERVFRLHRLFDP